MRRVATITCVLVVVLVCDPSSAQPASGQPFDYAAIPTIVPRPSVATPMQVLAKPDGDALAKAFPSAAKKAHINGAARASCRVSEEGRPTDCFVEWESAPGYGFGEAALKLVTQFRLKPATRDGRVMSAVRFRPAFAFSRFDDAAPPPPPPPPTPMGAPRGSYTPSPTELQAIVLPTGPLTVVGRSDMGFTRFVAKQKVDATLGSVKGVALNIYAWPNGLPAYEVEQVRADCGRQEIARLGSRSFDSARRVSGWALADDDAPRPVEDDFARNDLGGLCDATLLERQVDTLEAAVMLVRTWPAD